MNDDENYEDFLKSITNREKETALITVSNHRSVMDDPGIMGSILPVSIFFILLS